MRKKLLAGLLLMVCLYTSTHAKPFIDSARINHLIDGNIGEWAIDKLETDKETRIQYAVDNDANNLYLAVKVSNQQLQVKMMSMGMNLYLDKKGRKREGTGIEFPIRRENGGFSNGRGGRTGTGEPGSGSTDPKEMKEKLATTMIILKTFGFDDQEDQTQLISQPNSINLAFDWDEANNLYIEYLVPLRFLGGQTALIGKTLGVGWKISAPEIPVAAPTAVTTQLVGVTAGSGRPISGGGSRTGGARAGGGSTGGAGFSNVDNRMREQSFWTKYVMSF